MSPLKKSTPNFKKADAKERLKRYHANEAGKKKFGKAAVKGKTIHHKNGSNTDNSPGNLELKSREAHGKLHGRSNGKRGKNPPKK